MTVNLEQKLHQRMAKALKLAVKFKGIVVFRNVGQRFANQQDVLSTKGSYDWGGRYNVAGDFGVLYLSCDIRTCLAELEYAARYEGINVGEKLPRTFTGVHIKLTKVLDLTDAKVLRELGISSRILVSDWVKENREGRDAPTQIIGRAAKRAGFNALLVPSARAAGKNLTLLDDGHILLRASVINMQLLDARRRGRRHRRL